MSDNPQRPRTAPAGLVNPVWRALTGPQSELALAAPGARRLHPAVGPFCAVPDSPSLADLSSLAELLGSDSGVLFRPRIDLPDGWTAGPQWPCLQFGLLGAVPSGRGRAATSRLGPADVAEMIDLVARTQPGPFEPRTIETGPYLGIRSDDGELVAMAGERLRIPGATEISAVCVADHARGRGYAQDLVLAVAQGIAARGDIPFLHVVTDNSPAVALYQRLGFTVLRQTLAQQVAPPGADPIAAAHH